MYVRHIDGRIIFNNTLLAFNAEVKPLLDKSYGSGRTTESPSYCMESAILMGSRERRNAMTKDTHKKDGSAKLIFHASEMQVCGHSRYLPSHENE